MMKEMQKQFKISVKNKTIYKQYVRILFLQNKNRRCQKLKIKNELRKIDNQSINKEFIVFKKYEKFY